MSLNSDINTLINLSNNNLCNLINEVVRIACVRGEGMLRTSTIFKN